VTVRTPAPPYVGEGPHALWHVSENPSIERVRAARQRDGQQPGAPCLGPSTRGTCRCTGFRGSARAGRSGRPPRRRPTTPSFLAGSDRVHIVETGWSIECRRPVSTPIALAEESFAPDEEVGGYWLSRRHRLDRSTSSSSTTSSSDIAPPQSSSARSTTCGRCGVASSRRRSSSAGSGCTTRCRPA
jgi:hypothetical protein